METQPKIQLQFAIYMYTKQTATLIWWELLLHEVQFLESKHSIVYNAWQDTFGDEYTHSV